MASGEVTYPVTSGESGNTLYIKVVDINTGKPITQGTAVLPDVTVTSIRITRDL